MEEPHDCPKLDALLRGGPLDGTVITVPMLESGKVPDHLRLAESHQHKGDTCMTSVLLYDLENERADGADVLYGWRKRDVSLADLSA